MILIEGSDLTGKTTLANALHYQLQVPLVHMVQPNFRHWTVSKYVCESIRHAVYDRYHWSGLVYDEVCRPTEASVWTVQVCCQLDTELRAKQPPYISVLITSDTSLLAKRVKAKLATGRVEMFSLDQILAVNTRFKELAKHFDVHYELTEYDPFVTNFSKIYQALFFAR